MNLSDKKLLIIGCGGGYDIFCGLPLYFQNQHHEKPILANHSFTQHKLLSLGKSVKVDSKETSVFEIDAEKFQLPTLEESDVEKVPSWLLKQLGITKKEYNAQQINGTCTNYQHYFPEYQLSQAIDQSVYAFHGELGAQGIIKALQQIIDQHNIEVVVVIDGGTDSLMSGDFGNLNTIGTPYEDMLTLACINQLKGVVCYLYVLGYNIDVVHGISDSDLNIEMLKLIQSGAFLGCYHILNYPESAKKYRETFLACSPENSWINSLITFSLLGQDGTPEWIEKYRGKSKISINPLMGLYWIYDASKLIASKKWRMLKLSETKNDREVYQLINEVFN